MPHRQCRDAECNTCRGDTRVVGKTTMDLLLEHFAATCTPQFADRRLKCPACGSLDVCFVTAEPDEINQRQHIFYGCREWECSHIDTVENFHVVG